MPLDANSGELQELMVFMASLSHGMEQTLGRGATTIAFRAGVTVGLKDEVSDRSDDPVEAVELVLAALRKRGVNWEVEPWKSSSQAELVYETEGKLAMKVVCRHCMIRCALFRYSHEQQLSLCNMNHGQFCGIFQQITGRRAQLEILHAGESACLKELSWQKQGGGE